MTFQLVKSKTSCFECYIWKIDVEHYYKNCNTIQLFPMAINLYFGICEEKELETLLDRQHFLRISFYEEGKESRIKIQCLTIEDLVDPKYQELLRSCPQEMLPVEINLGTYWHYMGINRLMCQMREVRTSFIFPGIGYTMGTVLYGRDSYLGESEEQIKEVEKGDEIFIVRKEYN